jgi:TonB family protein
VRTALSRVLLVALLGVAVYALVREPAQRSGAAVSIEGVGAEEVEWQAFRLSGPARLAVDAAGAFEEGGSPASDTTLAAAAWIVRREDGAVVWRLDPERPGRGTFVAVRDTVRLPAGTYDAYVATFGDPLVRAPLEGGSLGERVRALLSRGGQSWKGDAGRWRLVATPVGSEARAALVRPGSDRPEDVASDPAVLWRARAVRSGRRHEALLRVTAPARLRVRATTEVVDGVVADSASVVRLGTRDTVWSARSGAGTWAGGSVKNRLFDEALALAPGLYRVAFEADRSHAYGNWTANPPFRPWAWGIEVSEVEPAGAVTLLDPSTLDLPRIAAFECVGPDERRVDVFTLPDPTDVLVVAVGEVKSGRRYDWAALDREDGGWDEVWEMGTRGLEWAGGAEKNRRAVAALSLAPGTYRLRYESDGSHDCRSGYNSGGGPGRPLWGAAVYAADPAFDLGAVGRVAPPPAPPPPPGPPPDVGPEVYEVAEVQPELVGGLEALQASLEYPESARREGVEGRVVVQFVVDEEGRVLDPVAVRSPDGRLAEAALEAVEAAAFRPGRRRGEPVKVRFSVPVTFRLR